MIQLLRKYFKGDMVIWVTTLILLGFSLVSVYSFVPILVKMEGGTPFKYLFKHFVHVMLGFGIIYFIHKTPYHYFKALSTDTGIPYQNLINLYLLDCAKEQRRLALTWKK
jgi:cell division protein FtsW